MSTGDEHHQQTITNLISVLRDAQATLEDRMAATDDLSAAESNRLPEDVRNSIARFITGFSRPPEPNDIPGTGGRFDSDRLRAHLVRAFAGTRDVKIATSIVRAFSILMDDEQSGSPLNKAIEDAFGRPEATTIREILIEDVIRVHARDPEEITHNGEALALLGELSNLEVTVLCQDVLMKAFEINHESFYVLDLIGTLEGDTRPIAVRTLVALASDADLLAEAGLRAYALRTLRWGKRPVMGLVPAEEVVGILHTPDIDEEVTTEARLLLKEMQDELGVSYPEGWLNPATGRAREHRLAWLWPIDPLSIYGALSLVVLLACPAAILLGQGVEITAMLALFHVCAAFELVEYRRKVTPEEPELAAREINWMRLDAALIGASLLRLAL